MADTLTVDPAVSPVDGGAHDGEAPTPDKGILVYRYGLLPPVAGGDRVGDQIHLAHRYQNQLVEIERSRREAVRAVLLGHADVEGKAAALQQLEEDLERHRAAIKARRVATRERKSPPEERERSTQLRDQLRAARADIKAAKAALRTDPAIQAALQAVNDDHKARVRAARATCGVYWGTYLQIEQAMDQARRAVMDPRFRRWTGDGAVAVQLQGGLPWSDAIEAEDQRLRVMLAPQPVPGRGGKPRPRVLLRVGSEGRAPVWAEWPLVYHRPVPDGAVVKWAKVVRRLVAAKEHWSLHLTLEVPTPATAPGAGHPGVVAVDLGWRSTQEPGTPTLRAGGWADDDGLAEDILLNASIPASLRKAEELRSIRDRHQNEIQAALIAWKDTHPLPAEEHQERWANLALWRSPGRFASLALWWREHRFDGDSDMYEALEAWRKKDKHLWLWEANARRSALLRRREQYRVLAARLASRYGTLVIERLDLRALAEIPPPESAREPGAPKARSQRHDTAPSELRTALELAFRSRGGLVVSVPPGGPAATLLASYREQLGAVAKAAPARTSRFKRLRGSRPTNVPSDDSLQEPLDSDGPNA